MPYKDPEKQRIAQAEHYQRNKRAYRDLMRGRKASYWGRVLEYLSDHPCVDCGERDPVVLEFDHREPSQKTYSISKYHNHRIGLDKLETELAKCDVRCANCHRRKTSKQFGWRNKAPVAQLEEHPISTR